MRTTTSRAKPLDNLKFLERTDKLTQLRKYSVLGPLITTLLVLLHCGLFLVSPTSIQSKVLIYRYIALDVNTMKGLQELNLSVLKNSPFNPGLLVKEFHRSPEGGRFESRPVGKKKLCSTLLRPHPRGCAPCVWTSDKVRPGHPLCVYVQVCMCSPASRWV